MIDAFAFWGCGKGPVRSLHPRTRILSGVFAGASALVVPLHLTSGIACIVAVTALWCAFSGMPAKMILRCAALSAILFFPYLLLTPWMAAPAGAPMVERFFISGSIILRSACCLFIAASTIAALPLYDVHRGLSCGLLPRSFVALIVQLINQTMLLAEETARIIVVLKLRGATGMRGMRALFSFPIVWMVRMLFRAERNAAAMTVRGYGIEAATKSESAPLSIAEVAVIACAAAFLAASVCMRLRILG